MTSSRLVRGSKTRMFATVGLVCVLGAVLFVFHGAQTKLTLVEKQASSCTHENELLNARMQVFSESKDRLEKSLNKEKEDHRMTIELKEKVAKEMAELTNKYDALTQKNYLLEDAKELVMQKVDSLQQELGTVQTSLSNVKKQYEDAKLKNDQHEKIQTDYLVQLELIKNLKKEIENLKLKSLPEVQRKDYLEKQNEQLKRELEDAKHELALCKDREPSPKPSQAPARPNPPESNVGDMPHLVKNSPSTPGINPDAVGESSSVKTVGKDHEGEVMRSHVGPSPGKSTAESVIPLAQPNRKVEEDGLVEQRQAQIPMPGGNPRGAAPLNRPDTEDENVNMIEGDTGLDQPQIQSQLSDSAKGLLFPPQDPNRGEEEDEQGGGPPPFPKPGRNPDHYHGGDYDKEQAEEEDEEGGEQLDYDGDRSFKDGIKRKAAAQSVLLLPQQPKHGIMINPK